MRILIAREKFLAIACNSARDRLVDRNQLVGHPCTMQSIISWGDGRLHLSNSLKDPFTGYQLKKRNSVHNAIPEVIEPYST